MLTSLPSMEVHAGDLPRLGVRHEEVQTLALADEGAPVRRHVYYNLLGQFPGGLVERLYLVRDTRDPGC